MRSSVGWPFPESIIQKLHRRVGHGGFSLSDQPVFVLKTQNMKTPDKRRCFKVSDVRKVWWWDVVPSRGCWSWGLWELWCCWSCSGTEERPSRGSEGPAWKPSWRTAGSLIYTGGNPETCWPDGRREKADAYQTLNSELDRQVIHWINVLSYIPPLGEV